MLDVNLITLSFQDPDLEKRFRANYLRRYRLQSLLALEVALLLFSLFAILDWLLYPQLVKQLWLIRFGFALPALLVILALLLGKKYYCCGQPLMALALLVASATVAAMTVVIPSEMNDVYVAGLMLVAMYGFTVSRLRFLWANAGSWSGLLIYNLANIYWGDPSSWDLIAANFFCISTNVMGMVASYSMEYDSRQSFLLQRQLREERSRLKQVNALLESQVLTDELTQLANRRSFFEHFQDEWLRARRNRHSLSLIMVDVDHFKRVNDEYGHQAGDVCLQQIAKALAAHARRAGEMAARLGGEEFILLLPESSAISVCEVAESVRRDIELLDIGVNRFATRNILHLTVSCGAASVIPDAEYEPQMLLSASDKAMYKAKGLGRNRVICVDLRDKSQNTGLG
jgi:diguanylate cyclase (GGDEF)-like protein